MTIHVIDGRRIRTELVYPPISDHSFDWSAVDDSTYNGPGCPIGWGHTEWEAIEDLLQLLLDEDE